MGNLICYCINTFGCKMSFIYFQMVRRPTVCLGQKLPNKAEILSLDWRFISKQIIRIINLGIPFMKMLTFAVNEIKWSRK